MFDFIFKYSAVVYEQGSLLLKSRPPDSILGLAAVVVLALLFFAYRKSTAPLKKRWQVLFVSLRVLAILLLGVCLLEPVLSVSTVVPQKSSILILVDDSESMSIADAPGGTRRVDQVSAWLGANRQQGMWRELSKNFRVEVLRFSSSVEPYQGGELAGNGSSTDIGRAIDYALRKARQGALSGVVMVTDGAHSAGPDPLQAAQKLRPAKVPIFTVGVGSKIATDIQIAKVEASPSVLENSTVEVNAVIQARGFTGQTVELELREDNAVVQRKSIVLGDRSTRTSLQFVPRTKGHKKYTFTIPPQPGEIVEANNHKSFLVNSEDRTARVLYVAQLAPWEFKFMSRALTGDPALQLTSFLETGPEKYLRLGLRHSDELSDGFPQNRQELYDYQAIILGSVPSGFFDEDQLQLIHDFVTERGGGFMMLGGRRSFSQGGYERTVISELLPVELLPMSGTDGRGAIPQLQEEFRFTPTPEYLTLPLLQLDPDPVANNQRWDELPLLQGYNPLGPAKPGATILAVHPLHRSESPRILLATQRYGRGRSAVLATNTTWRWQMRMDHQDQGHERFWRQLVRWLSLQSPDPVTAELDRESYSPGETVVIQLDVRDSAYVAYENANISLKVIAPGGITRALPASPNLSSDQPGPRASYVASFEPEAEGLYQVDVLAHDKNGKFLGKAEAAFFVEPSQAELSNVDLQTPILQRLAEITGGHYFPIAQSQELASAMTVSRSSFSRLAEHDIWDAPFFFLIITLLLGIEWYFRRARGLS